MSRLTRPCIGKYVALCIGALSLLACASEPEPRPNRIPDLVAALRTADTQYAKGDLDGAERAYQRVLELDSKSVNANVRMGVIAHRRGDYTRAERHFHAVLADDPRNETATYNLAVIHVEQANVMLDRYLKVSSTKAAERPAVYEILRAMEKFRGS
jgi:tetratricopeptide (TPR) repeat protein